MPSIAKLSVDVDADTSGAEKALASVDTSIKRFGSGMVSGLRTATGVASAGFALASGAAVGFGVKAFGTAARVDELNGMLQVMAKNSGISYPAMMKQVQGVKSMGIETETAQNLVAQFTRSNLDMSKSTDLARVAQDAAIVTGKNSTDTLNEMLYAIQTGNSNLDIFQQMNIRGGQAVDEYAASIHKSTKDLTQQQRGQALMNAFLKAGIPLQGAYEASMQQPAKVLRSFPRLFNDIEVAAGQAVVQGFGPIILQAYKLVKAIDAAVQPGGVFNGIIKTIGNTLGGLTKPITDLLKHFTDLVGKMKPSQLAPINDFLKTLGPAALAAAAALATFGATKIPVIGQFAEMMPPWVSGIAMLVLGTKEGQQAFGQLIKSLMPLVSMIVKTLMPVINQLMSLFFQLIPPIMDIAGTIIGALVMAFKVLIPPIMSLIKTLLPPLMQIFNELVTTIVPLIPVIALFVGQMIALAVKALVPLMPMLVELANKLFPALAGVLMVVAPYLDELVSITMQLLPLFVDLLKVLIPIAGVIAEVGLKITGGLLSTLKPLIPIVLAIVAGFWLFKKALVVFEMVKKAIMFVRTAWMLLNLAFSISPIGFIITMVVGLVAVLILMYMRFKWFRDAIHKVIGAIGGFFVAMYHTIMRVVHDVINFVKKNWMLIVGALLGPLALSVALIWRFHDQIIRFFQRLWKDILKVLSAMGNAIVDFFKKLPGRILTGLKDLAKLLIKAFVMAMKGLVIALVWYFIVIPWLFVKLVIDIIKAVITLGPKLVKWIIKAITDTYNALVDTAKKIWDWFINFVPKAMAYLASLPGKLYNWAKDALVKLINGIHDAEVAIWNWFINFIPKALNYLASLPGKLYNWARSALNQLYQGLVSFAQTIYNWFIQLPGRLIGYLSGMATALYNWARSAASSLYNGFTSFLGAIVSFFQGLPGQIMRAIGNVGGALLGAGQQIMQGLWNGIVQVWNGIPGWFGRLGGVFGGFFTGCKTWLIGAGQQVVNGLWAGISAAWGWLVGQIQGAISHLPGFVKKFLGVKSPSKMFADLGKFIPQGLAKGINDNWYHVENALMKNPQVNIPVGTTLGMPGGLPGGALSAGAAAAANGVQIGEVHLHDELTMEQFIKKMNFLTTAGKL